MVIATTKRCNLAAQRERYVADPESAKARVRRWQQDNAGRLNEYRRVRRADPSVKRAERAGHLRRTYGITIEEYERLLASQGGGCAICGRQPRRDVSLHLDHDHESGQLRGILCFRCNNALGDFDDDPALLQQAVSYLLSYQAVDEFVLVRERVRQLKCAEHLRVER